MENQKPSAIAIEWLVFCFFDVIHPTLLRGGSAYRRIERILMKLANIYSTESCLAFCIQRWRNSQTPKPSINLHVDHTSDLRRSHTSFSTFFSSHRLHAVSIHLSTKQTNKTKRNAEVKKKEKQCKTKPYCFVCTSLQPTAAINASCNCINWRSNESDLQICAERPRFLSATAESMFANVSISHLLVVM